jgi:hypothetical protein
MKQQLMENKLDLCYPQRENSCDFLQERRISKGSSRKMKENML